MRSMDLRDPRPVEMLFGQTRFAWLWLIVRVYLGWQMLTVGRRLMRDPDWMERGNVLREFWERSISPSPAGAQPAHNLWYGDLIAFLLRHDANTWVAQVLAFGAVITGIALMLGALVGVSAFVGVILMIQLAPALAGGPNPVELSLTIVLMFAWKPAGWFGFDRWLLPIVGAPWSGGVLVRRLGRSRSPQTDSEPTTVKREAG